MSRPSPLQGRIEAHPFNFDRPDRLVESLRGASVLYNTYWVRFNATGFQHSVAVENSLTLFRAAKEAGVQRVVHVSITNPSEDSPLEYFHGKAVLERALRESGLSYAIIRPTVLFGEQDILINNIAWLLGWVLGHFIDDVVITRPEIEGLMADLLFVDAPPTGETPLSTWARTHSSDLGIRYSSEMERRRNRQSEYRPAA